MPRKDSDDSRDSREPRESRWSSSRQDSAPRGGGRGGRGSYRQSHDSGNWNRSGGARGQGLVYDAVFFPEQLDCFRYSITK